MGGLCQDPFEKLQKPITGKSISIMKECVLSKKRDEIPPSKSSLGRGHIIN